MSAPQTNIEKQTRRHRGPLIGMAVAAVFVGGLIIFWLMVQADTGDISGVVTPAAEGTQPTRIVPKNAPAP